MKTLTLFLLLGAPLTGLGAQAPCMTCDGAGLLPCRTCPSVEADVVACTVAAGCRTCHGARATVCEDCAASTAAGAALQRARDAADEFTAGSRLLLDEHGLGTRGVMRCRSPHFDLLFAIGGIEGCPESDPHLQLHLYAARLEELLEDIEGRLGITAEDPITIAVVKDERDQRRLARGLTGLEVQGHGRIRFTTRRVAVLQAPSPLSDAALQGLITHSATHLLLGSLEQSAYGWLGEGLAHWFESDRTGACKYFCVQAAPQKAVVFWGGDLRLAARELLESGNLPDLAEVLSTDASDLDLRGHALALALADFLLVQMPAPITHDAGPVAPPPLQVLLDAVSADPPSNIALSDVLSRDLREIEESLHQFIRQRYLRR